MWSSPLPAVVFVAWTLLISARGGIGQEAKIELLQPSEVSALKAGATLELDCKVDGQPTAAVQWYRNSVPLARDQLVENQRRLSIRNVSAEDNGVYSCAGKNDAGDARSRLDFLVNLEKHGVPKLLSLGQDGNSFVAKALVKRNDSFMLHCKFAPPAATLWKKEQKSSGFRNLTLSARVMQLTNGTLKVNNAMPGDKGLYMCTTTTGSAEFVTEVTLMRLEPFVREKSILPQPNAEGLPLLVKEGGTLELRCQRAIGLPMPTMRWETPSGPSTWLSPEDVAAAGGARHLIRAAVRSDSGNYSCVAENPVGEQRVTVAVLVTYPPVITKHPSNVSIEEGQSHVLSCEYRGLPYPITNVTWLVNGHRVLTNGTADQESGQLRLESVGTTAEGDYACQVTTGDEVPVTSFPASVRVLQRLQFLPTPVNKMLQTGDDERVVCNARGTGKVTVHWMRLPAGTPVANVGADGPGVLEFKQARKSDAGYYSCVAQDDRSVINVTIRIDVGVRPKFSEMPSNMTAFVGRAANMGCGHVLGDPVPTVQWSKWEGSKFVEVSLSTAAPAAATSLPRVVSFPNGTLHISNVKEEDQERYMCLAGSIHGFTSATVFLTVRRCSGASCDELTASADGMQDEPPKEEGLGMMQTIVIAVCSAVAYLALVIGLTIWCSVRLMRKKRLEKQQADAAAAIANGEASREPQETDRLMAPAKQNGHAQVVAVAAVTPSHAAVGFPQADPAGAHRSYPREKLQMVGMLGKGEYGDVYLARAPGLSVPHSGRPGSQPSRESEAAPLVYVKSLLAVDDKVARAQFSRELDTFGRLRHERVCALLGTCAGTATEPVLMLMEYCEWGDMKQFLMATRKDSGHQLTIAPPSLPHKISLCGQIAAAMEHVAARGLVHGDLAARNVLLQNDLAGAKLANLGLTRNVYAGEYYRTNGGSGEALPLRWMAPDAFAERCAGRQPSEADDVWSFGVFLWEVLTGGEMPYGERADEEVVALFEAAAAGGTESSAQPELHRDFDSGVAKVMSRCWAPMARDRPSFADIVAAFADFTVDSGV